jgi:ribosomal protein L37E
MNEQALVEELYAVIRFVYARRQKLAEKIITAFQEALAEKTDVAERQAVIAHWLDFYQAHRYRRLMSRRRTTAQERLTPCSACGYPLSQRHHLWDIATHGENQVTVQLCANCHDLHHLLYNAIARDSAYSQKLMRHVLAKDEPSAVVLRQIMGWLRAILAYEIERGWLEDYKLSDLWIEGKIGWQAYLNSSETHTP